VIEKPNPVIPVVLLERHRERARDVQPSLALFPEQHADDALVLLVALRVEPSESVKTRAKEAIRDRARLARPASSRVVPRRARAIPRPASSSSSSSSSSRVVVVVAPRRIVESDRRR
jgi:hypothetical protein